MLCKQEVKVQNQYFQLILFSKAAKTNIHTIWCSIVYIEHTLPNDGVVLLDRNSASNEHHYQDTKYPLQQQ